jgi:hypothetical protein
VTPTRDYGAEAPVEGVRQVRRDDERLIGIKLETTHAVVQQATDGRFEGGNTRRPCARRPDNVRFVFGPDVA